MGLKDDAIVVANWAVQFDTKGQTRAAIYYYNEARKLLEEAYAEEPNHPDASAWCSKAHEYSARVQMLRYQADVELQKNSHVSNDKGKLSLHQCHFLLKQGLDADESGFVDSAMQFYTMAVDTAIATMHEIEPSDDSGIIEKLKKTSATALDRAEKLKTNKKPNMKNDIRLEKQEASTKSTYTEEEKKVLQITSRINKHEFVPFMSVDLEERFQYSLPFTDDDGLLVLSAKQKAELVRWARPHEIFSDPVMIAGKCVDYLTIKQTIVTDCSLVASLAVSAKYEQMFGRRIISLVIYPRKRNKEPIYNPFGKYMIKLLINGVYRKIIVDDLLPVGKYNQLLCSYSTKKDELWISILEKAYMKVMGGYDFPGSNSNIDLHALTGWIPERQPLNSDDPTFNSAALFDLLLSRLHKGDVLVTIATGVFSSDTEKRTGLVGTHAYAVLDVRKINNVRLLQLKNPWSHIRWRGKYSELDTVRWTEEIKHALQYDPQSEYSFDNGIFWIDYESILHYFDVVYMNWNPGLFTHTFCTHETWIAGVGPMKDLYNISENPQFCLDIKDAKTGAVWILLTRHITELEDFKNNREFISVVVYKNNGKRVHYPNDPTPYIVGVRVNSPHYLCKIIITENSPRYFTCVVTQYEKMKTIYYTVRAYSTFPFALWKFQNYCKHSTQMNGKWDEKSAGGPRNNYSMFKNNPVFQVRLNSNQEFSCMLFELKGPKEFYLGIDVTLVKLDDESATARFKEVSSGAYRQGFVILEIDKAQSGIYNVVPSTYDPHQEGPFILIVKASDPVSVVRLR